ncbi:hypothetical protein ABBQ38_002160 [Trebouxia sp. C0009 RCD-2024]
MQHGASALGNRGLQRQLGQRFERSSGHQDSAQDMAAKGQMSPEALTLQSEITPGWVLVLTLFMAAASGLGAVPYFFVRSFSKEYSALASAVACGVMLAASFDLVHEGQPYGANMVILGVLSGAVFIQIIQTQLDKFGEVKFESLSGANARKIVLVIGIMSAHALGEGCGVGVSFCGTRGWAQGVLVSLAIGLHNIPEGLAVATVLVSRGVGAKKAAWWALFTALPQPLLAVPSFMFVDTFTFLLPLALGFAAGCMTWIVFAELIPDALAAAPHGKVATTATFSACALEALRMLLADLEQPGGTLTTPIKAPMALLLPVALALFPVVLPSGLIGGLLGRYKQPSGGLLGLAAGIMAVLATVSLTNQVLWGTRLGAVPSLAWAGAGALSTWLTWRHHQGDALAHISKGGGRYQPPDEHAQAEEGALDHPKTSGQDFGVMSARAGSETQLSQPDSMSSHANGHAPWANGTEESNSVLSWAYPPVGSPPTARQGPPQPGSISKQRHGKRSIPAYSSRESVSSTHLVGVGLCLAGLAGHSLCEGWGAASATVSGAAGTASIALPLYMTGTLKGAAAGILAGVVCRQKAVQSGLVGASIAGLMPVAAIVSLAQAPLGDVPAGFRTDPSGITSKVAASVAGALLVLSLRILMPIANRTHKQSSVKGLLSGAACAGVVFGLRGAICMLAALCIPAP